MFSRSTPHIQYIIKIGIGKIYYKYLERRIQIPFGIRWTVRQVAGMCSVKEKPEQFRDMPCFAVRHPKFVTKLDTRSAVVLNVLLYGAIYGEQSKLTEEHMNNFIRKLKTKKKKKHKRNPQQHRLGTNVRVRGFKARLLARSLFASGRSCDRPTRSRFSMVFISPRANAELVPKFHVALHASHAALPMVTLKFRLALT
jgi:hypothetical protein